MKKMLLIGLCALLLPALALGEFFSTGVESTRFLGNGMIEIEYPSDAEFASYAFEVAAADGTALTVAVDNIDRDDAHLTVEGLLPDQEYTVTVKKGGVLIGTAPVKATYGTKYVVRCDECGALDHGYERCPYEDWDDANERCDICGGTDHDDEACISRAKGGAEVGRGDHRYDDDDDRYERCDICGVTGHDDDDCPNRPAGKRGDWDEDRDDDRDDDHDDWDDGD